MLGISMNNTGLRKKFLYLSSPSSYPTNTEFEQELKVAVLANNLEKVTELLASEHEGNIEGALALASYWNRQEMVRLLLTSERKCDITRALVEADSRSPEVITLLLTSGREYDAAFVLLSAATYLNLELIKPLLISARNYNIQDVLDFRIHPAIVAELENPSYAQYAVKTGKNTEGSKTHHWQIGGLAFLAARAVVAHESGGTEQLPLRLRAI